MKMPTPSIGVGLYWCSSGGVSETPTQSLPPAHLYYSDGAVFSSVVTVKINNSHHRCKFAFSPWSKYLARLWRGSIHSRCGTTARSPFPVLGANPSKLRVGLDWCARGGFAVKTLAQSPSATPAPFSFSFSFVIVNAIYFLFQALALRVIRCASVGSFLETRTEGPTVTPVLLLRCRVFDSFQTYLADNS